MEMPDPLHGADRQPGSALTSRLLNHQIPSLLDCLQDRVEPFFLSWPGNEGDRGIVCLGIVGPAEGVDVEKDVVLAGPAQRLPLRLGFARELGKVAAELKIRLALARYRLVPGLLTEPTQEGSLSPGFEVLAATLHTTNQSRL